MEPSNSGAELHDNEVNKRKLMNAVHNSDVETARQLIGEGININFILDHYSPLHAAVKQESMDMLELLLSQPNIDLNILNERKETPLLRSLHFWWGSECVVRLIRAGCDTNISDEYGRTPFDLALKNGLKGTTAITNELLKRGADVNTFYPQYGSALHYAVSKGNLEFVCMLLYYNADVYMKWEGHTPFSLALNQYQFKIVEVLSDYYSFLDDDVSYIIDIDKVCIPFVKYNAELFKAVWPRFNSEIILSRCPKFISYYLTWCKYSTSDWVECLYLILNSDIASDLIEHAGNFFDDLLKSMLERDVQSEDRIGLLYMALSSGYEIKIKNINTAVAIYGLNQDLEPYIYHTYTSITDDSKLIICPLHAFVIGMQTDYSIKNISQLFHDTSKKWLHQYGFNEMWDEDKLVETCIKPVAFFSFPADVKKYIINLYDELGFHLTFFATHGHDIAFRVMFTERLKEIPEFPSLTELSRNQTHKYLVEKFRFKQPYQLEDCVKKLLIPDKIKNIILFKEPIY